MNLKHKIKAYFKTRQSSDSAVELFRMFILPFMKAWNPEASVDDAVAAFFAVEKRKFYHANAKKSFRLPGVVARPHRKMSQSAPARFLAQGQYLLLAIDKQDQNARVDVTTMGKDRTFLLTRPELEYIKDYIEVKEI